MKTRSILTLCCLVRASQLISSVLGELCTCLSNPSIILPPSPPTTLSNLKTLLYTGVVSNLSADHANHVSDMAKQMGMDISLHLIGNAEYDDTADGHNESEKVDTDSALDADQVELKSTLLSIDPLVSDHKCGDSINLRFPKSRLKRQQLSMKILRNYLVLKGGFKRNTTPIPLVSIWDHMIRMSY